MGLSWLVFLHHCINQLVTVLGICWKFLCLEGTLCLCSCSVLCGSEAFHPPINQSPSPVLLPSLIPKTPIWWIESSSRHIFNESSIFPRELFMSSLELLHCLAHHQLHSPSHLTAVESFLRAGHCITGNDIHDAFFVVIPVDEWERDLQGTNRYPRWFSWSEGCARNK